MSEEWRDIPGYEGLYEVSNLGNVRPVQRNLRQFRGTKGYFQVSLSKDGKASSRPVHLLVLAAFRGPRPGRQMGLHGPNGKDDNSIENLSYGDGKKNQLDRIRDGTDSRGEKGPAAKLTDEIVLECRRRYAAGEKQTALALEFRVSDGLMSMAIRGRRWGHLPGAVVGGKPSQRTPEARARMAEQGRRGAASRWASSGPVT